MHWFWLHRDLIKTKFEWHWWILNDDFNRHNVLWPVVVLGQLPNCYFFFFFFFFWSQTTPVSTFFTNYTTVLDFSDTVLLIQFVLPACVHTVCTYLCVCVCVCVCVCGGGALALCLAKKKKKVKLNNNNNNITAWSNLEMMSQPAQDHPKNKET